MTRSSVWERKKSIPISHRNQLFSMYLEIFKWSLSTDVYAHIRFSSSNWQCHQRVTLIIHHHQLVFVDRSEATRRVFFFSFDNSNCSLIRNQWVFFFFSFVVFEKANKRNVSYQNSAHLFFRCFSFSFDRCWRESRLLFERFLFFFSFFSSSSFETNRIDDVFFAKFFLCSVILLVLLLLT